MMSLSKRRVWWYGRGALVVCALTLLALIPAQGAARSCKPPNLGDVAVIYRMKAVGISCWDANGVVAAAASRRSMPTTLWGTWRCWTTPMDETSWRYTCTASRGRRVTAWATVF